MQCIKMLNLLVLKLINHLTAKSKGLRWGTKYLFIYIISFIIYHEGVGEGGGNLEDHMIFRGKGGGNSCRRKSLKGGRL